MAASDGKGGERSHTPHLILSYCSVKEWISPFQSVTLRLAAKKQIADYNYRFCDDYLERKFIDVFCIRIQISNIAVDSFTKLRLGCPDEKEHACGGIKSKSNRRKTSISKIQGDGRKFLDSF